MHLFHSHEHDECCHGPVPDKLNRSFAIAVVLNTLLVVGEFAGGLYSGSVALLADAGHNLSDVAGLVLAWVANWLRSRKATYRWTYGFRSFTILAANINAILIVLAIVGVSIESIRRLIQPVDVEELPVIVVALFAALLNFWTASLLSGKRDDLNVQGAYLHMMADAAVSVAVVVGASLIWLTGWIWLDPGLSLAICILLSFGTWRLLKESTSMLMQAAPNNLEFEDVKSLLMSTPEIVEVQDLHIWSLSTTEVALSARIRCPDLDALSQDPFLRDLHASLHQEFSIGHSTIEITRGENDLLGCNLSPPT